MFGILCLEFCVRLFVGLELPIFTVNLSFGVVVVVLVGFPCAGSLDAPLFATALSFLSLKFPDGVFFNTAGGLVLLGADGTVCPVLSFGDVPLPLLEHNIIGIGAKVCTCLSFLNTLMLLTFIPGSGVDASDTL